MTGLTLHEFRPSSACFRVRIALELKSLDYDVSPVDLYSGDQHTPLFRQQNPQALVPVLETDQARLTQSLAIIDWLDSVFPSPRVIPSDPTERATVLAMALTIACDTQPLINLRVWKYVQDRLSQPDDAMATWYRHWVGEGLGALEAMSEVHGGRFVFGDEPTLADIYLVPQIFNAMKHGFALDAYPRLVRAFNHANELPAFRRAHPDSDVSSEISRTTDRTI